MFTFHIIVKIRINRHTRAKILYKLIYRGIFYHAFFLFACERSFETASFCLKFWLFSSRRPRKLILSIFSKSKRPFEKQTTPRLITYLYLAMDKIWGKMIFWLLPRNFDFARFLQTFALKHFTRFSENPRAQWNGTFQLHWPNKSHREFGYRACKQDTDQWSWSDRLDQIRSVSVKGLHSQGETIRACAKAGWGQCFFFLSAGRVTLLHETGFLHTRGIKIFGYKIVIEKESKKISKFSKKMILKPL